MTGIISNGRYDQCVPDLPPSPIADGPLPWLPRLVPARSRPWLTFALVGTALRVIFGGIAVVGWFRRGQLKRPQPQTYTTQQAAAVKTKVRAAHEKFHNTINSSTSRDTTSQLAFAINGQQAVNSGSDHLRTTVAQQPAAPCDLATAIRQLSDVFQELVGEYQNKLSDAEEEPTIHAADETTLAIESFCA